MLPDMESVRPVIVRRDQDRKPYAIANSSINSAGTLGDCKTDNEVLAFVRENGFPNATILPEDQP